MILLSTGSQTTIPPIEGLEETGFLTSDSILYETKLPRSIAIVGGGYIAGEYGHFLSAMGSEVTIIGRNPQFLPQEEPEISALAKEELGKHMMVLTNHEVTQVSKAPGGKKKLIAVERGTGRKTPIVTDATMIATGRGPGTDMLRPDLAGIKTDAKGWIIVDQYLQTTCPNVWALGDANGRYLFKHKANYDAEVVYYNAVLGRKVAYDYHAVPHAVFTDPEIASVGLREKEALDRCGSDRILIGFERYEDTAKGEAMAVKKYFVKAILEKDTFRILGAHLIGPEASVLIQEIINLMYTPEQSARPLMTAMHIHPALSEVVQRAFGSLMTPEQYHHQLTHMMSHEEQY
jgi:dihydrolipoamide dehydrogenase